MTFFPCQVERKHQHRQKSITVDLSKPHLYDDYPQIPHWLVPAPFEMKVWDQGFAPDAAEGWCPARDVVSETIQSHGIWEPVETIVMLDLFDRLPNGLFWDIGAQLGWYSILAQRAGWWVTAFEPDANVRRLLSQNIRADQACIGQDPIGPDTEPVIIPDEDHIPAAVVKIDIEGEEAHALRMIEPVLACHEVTAVLIELSPCFGVDMDEITGYFTRYGYVPAMLPNKSMPPTQFTGLPDLEYLASWSPVVDAANAAGQINVLAVDSGWLA